MKVGIRELKRGLSRYIALVREGETIVITDRGKPVARLERELTEELPPQLRRLYEAGKLNLKPRLRSLPTPVEMLPGEKTSLDYVIEQRR